MTDLKRVVSAFCELLRFMGIGDLHPETLRCAKFNKVTSVEPLFTSLRVLVDMQSTEFFTGDSRAAFISRVMLKSAYGRDKFYKWLANAFSDNVSRDQSEIVEVGSRELLLAFVWLLWHMRIFDIYSFYIRRCFVCLTTSLPSSSSVCRIERTIKCPRDWWKWMEEQNLSIARESSNTVDKPSYNETDQYLVQQALTSRNKIAAIAKAVYSTEKGIAKLSSKTHKATERTGSISSGQPKHWSLNDVYLVRHPDLLRKCSHLLEKLIERLEKLVAWTQQSQLFWQWMESIVDVEHVEMTSGCTPHNDTTKRSQCILTNSSDIILPDRRSPVWTWHLRWVGSFPTKRVIGTTETETCSVKCKTEEVTAEVARLEAKLKGLQQQCKLHVDRVKGLFPELTFETCDIRLRKK